MWRQEIETKHTLAIVSESVRPIVIHQHDQPACKKYLFYGGDNKKKNGVGSFGLHNVSWSWPDWSSEKKRKRKKERPGTLMPGGILDQYVNLTQTESITWL